MKKYLHEKRSPGLETRHESQENRLFFSKPFLIEISSKKKYSNCFTCAHLKRATLYKRHALHYVLHRGERVRDLWRLHGFASWEIYVLPTAGLMDRTDVLKTRMLLLKLYCFYDATRWNHRKNSVVHRKKTSPISNGQLTLSQVLFNFPINNLLALVLEQALSWWDPI